MNHMSRRTVLRSLGLGLVGAPSLLRGRFCLFSDSTVEYSARAIRIMEEATVVDLLNQFRFPDYTQKRPWPWSEYPWFDKWLHRLFHELGCQDVSGIRDQRTCAWYRSP